MNLKIVLFIGGAMVGVIGLPIFLSNANNNNRSVATLPLMPEVGVVTLKTRSVTLTTELPGRTAAFRSADVRPQVSGILQHRLFTEGDVVRAGQPLYQVDAALYRVDYNRSTAALARAKAQWRAASQLVQRYRPLAERNVISRQAYDDALATMDQTDADVKSAEAVLEGARINLVYTKVLSPIDGIIGRSSVTEGALLTAQQALAIASVQQIDPMYVDVTQSSVQLLRLQKSLAEGVFKRGDGEVSAEVTLTLEDGSRYEQTGKLQFADITVDQTTGSMLLRAVFPNPDRKLLPGMFVRARLVDGVARDGLLVPQRGITRDPRGEPTALVVNGNNQVELRVLKTDRTVGDQWLVTNGLAEGDQVIVEGVQQVRPGVRVNAREWGSPNGSHADRSIDEKVMPHG
ncbi:MULTISPECIES: efflux RND transporter periplasmic adaptor subunit [Citrobacter]|uniref:efflux RND transporter periplasmic adaptor subunit n=1 Tax=Citrobacter TaxID=544 RepID=UPI000E3B6DD0|nr:MULTISPECIES: efflux RND transporter periplasmic adaptor subunit [Citrobacter]MBD0826608.1 efflux RND transporter periplasmic adaptor subunit [Citrobacter sp. C1]RFU93330.1 efflux RND transporter periplasmic adaptor subunit [Citrobacter gillenii]